MTMNPNTQSSPAGTTTSDPQQLRQEIEQTRANLSQNVNALGEAVAPSSIARRQVDKAKGAAVGVKDKVMGSAEGAASAVHDSAAGLGTGLGSSLGDGVGSAGRTTRSRAQGNPLAAGMIALGAGWLAGSLLPATAGERQAAGKVREQAQPLVSQAQEAAQGVAQQVSQELKEPAREAAQSVKATTQDAVETVKADGRSAVEDVRASAEDSRQAVQEHHDRPGTSL